MAEGIVDEVEVDLVEFHGSTYLQLVVDLHPTEEPEELLRPIRAEDEAEEGGEGRGLLIEHRGLLGDVVEEGAARGGRHVSAAVGDVIREGGETFRHEP